MRQALTFVSLNHESTPRHGKTRTHLSRARTALFAGGFIAAAALAFLLSGYQLFQATMIIAYGVALLGLNILTGYNGQISLGHGAFFALGSYLTAVLMTSFGVPFWAAVVASGAASMAVGYAFGIPAVRLEGLYLALATFALGVAVPQLLKAHFLEQWTGGVQGISLDKPEAPFGLPLSPDQWLYLCALIAAVFLFWTAINLLQGEPGRIMRAIRDHEIAAQAMGVNTSHYKALTFSVSAGYTGIGGGISALAVQFVAPDSFTMFLSISLLVGIVIGGIGTVWGAFFGAVFILFVPALAESVSKAAPWAVYGGVLIIFMFLMPSGVVGLLRRVLHWRN